MTEKRSVPKKRSRARSVRKRNALERYKRVLGSHLPELRERYGVRTLGIFGSFVRGEAAEKSDLDILVEFEKRKVTMFKFVELENYLSKLLGIKVDLVLKSALKPNIGKQILSEVIML